LQHRDEFFEAVPMPAPPLLFSNFCIIALLSHTRTIDRPFSALESLPPQTLISSISAAR
jgi:hypothetical protein